MTEYGGGAPTTKKETSPTRVLSEGRGLGARDKEVAGINKVSCKFHVTLFGCRVGDVGQLKLRHLLQ